MVPVCEWLYGKCHEYLIDFSIFSLNFIKNCSSSDYNRSWKSYCYIPLVENIYYPCLVYLHSIFAYKVLTLYLGKFLFCVYILLLLMLKMLKYVSAKLWFSVRYASSVFGDDFCRQTALSTWLDFPFFFTKLKY